MFKKTYLMAGAAMTMGLMANSTAAMAQDDASGNNFGSIASNIVDSIADLPGLISALSYLFAMLLSVLGIMKIKDHVENPTQTPLKDGAIRLAAGGALFALPIVSEAMFTTVGSGTAADVSELNKVSMGLSN